MPAQLPRRRATATTDTEVLDLLDAEGRVELELNANQTVTLRKSNGTYYCDTAVKLHTYDDPEGMCACLEQLGVPTGGQPDAQSA